jgi:hypothetical protein
MWYIIYLHQKHDSECTSFEFNLKQKVLKFDKQFFDDLTYQKDDFRNYIDSKDDTI